MHVDIAVIAAPCADFVRQRQRRERPGGVRLPQLRPRRLALRRQGHRGHRPPRAVPRHPLADPGQQRGLRRRRWTSVGDPTKIVSGTTEVTNSPDRLLIAELVARFVRDAGIMRDGFSFQAGAGGTTLAFAIYLKEMMQKAGREGALRPRRLDEVPRARCWSEGLTDYILDGQTFDLDGVASMRDNPRHVATSPLHLLQLPRQGVLRDPRGRRGPRRHRGGCQLQRERGHPLRRPAPATGSAAGRTASSRAAPSSRSRPSGTASR